MTRHGCHNVVCGVPGFCVMILSQLISTGRQAWLCQFVLKTSRKALVSANVPSKPAQNTQTACLRAPLLSYSKPLLRQEKAAAPAHPVPPKSAGKLYLVPKSLPELFELLSGYAQQPEEFRVIAGNTGAGVYHDWPLERVLIDINSIPDLTKIEYSKVCEVHVASFVTV